MAKGKRLKAPPGTNTRPITDMIKEALFNVLGHDMSGIVFLDLFAGSGSVGIEALSRGASRVIFVDSSYHAVKTIKYNLINCNFMDGYEIYRQDVFRAIYNLQRHQITFDLIYADPPFPLDSVFTRVMTAIDDAQILKNHGLAIIRTPRKKVLPQTIGFLIEYKTSIYGDSCLHYYYKEVK